MYKVLIVDDSAFVRKMVREMLLRDPELEVIAEAGDGAQALKLAQSGNPDVIILDLILPGYDGITVIEKLFAVRPVPVVLFSALTDNNSEITEHLFRYGVLDVIKKPENPTSLKLLENELVSKVKAAAKSRSVFEALYKNYPARPSLRLTSGALPKSAVAIVASAGSPICLTSLLKDISEKSGQLQMTDAVVLVALHMPGGFLQSYVQSARTVSSLDIKIARSGEIIKGKSVYFSPSATTLCLKKIRIGVVGELDNLDLKLQPDFDHFLKSVANTFARNSTAIVLSGMGCYGLEGARACKQAGGTVIVQEPSTAGVSSMPQSILAEGLADASLPIEQIASLVFKLQSVPGHSQ